MEILLSLSIYISGALSVLWLITIAFDLFLK